MPAGHRRTGREGKDPDAEPATETVERIHVRRSGRRVRPVTARFEDRVDAGRRLADALEEMTLGDPVILGLPRGGIPVAFEVAQRLRAPLDLLIVRKVGAPGHPELGIGAVAEDGEAMVDRVTAREVGADPETVDRLVAQERREVQRRVADYRSGRQLPRLAGRDVVLVDDGLATGVTAEAAIRAMRRRVPRTLVLAVPVGAPGSIARLRPLTDDVVCLLSPQNFTAVGLWYHHFEQTTDEEVLELLARSAEWSSGLS